MQVPPYVKFAEGSLRGHLQVRLERWQGVVASLFHLFVDLAKSPDVIEYFVHLSDSLLGTTTPFWFKSFMLEKKKEKQNAKKNEKQLKTILIKTLIYTAEA